MVPASSFTTTPAEHPKVMSSMNCQLVSAAVPALWSLHAFRGHDVPKRTSMTASSDSTMTVDRPSLRLANDASVARADPLEERMAGVRIAGIPP